MDSQEKAALEFAKMLEEVPDDRLPMVLLYCANIALVAEKIADVKDEESLLEIVSCRAVDPIVETAQQSERPDELMSFLLELDEEKLMGDLVRTLQASSLDEEAKQRVLGDLPSYLSRTWELVGRRLDIWYRRFAGAEDVVERRISHWISDIRKFWKDGDSKRLESRKKGFFNSLQGVRKYVRRQLDITESSRKHATRLSDISIWYSRYLLVPALENAKDGYLGELANVCQELLDEDELLEGCMKFASELGFQAAKGSFDVLQLRDAVQQLSRARTGYNFPENYLMSLIPAAEYEDRNRRRGLPLNVG